MKRLFILGSLLVVFFGIIWGGAYLFYEVIPKDHWTTIPLAITLLLGLMTSEIVFIKFW